MFDKKFIRKQIFSRRRVISAPESQIMGALLLSNLLPLLKDKKHVAIYHACNGEISLESTIRYLLDHDVKVYQPIAITGKRILRFEQMFSNKDSPIFVSQDYKIGNEIECYNLDLVIMPLVAADKLGNRIGQGGGYYDSTFAKKNVSTVFCGVGYDWQIFDQFVAEDHDVKLDYFVSDVQLLKFN